jgi:hypothetical protein
MTSLVNNLLRRQAVLAASALLVACGSAGYAVDSATSACRQNPAYCAHVAGEEAIVPTLRSVTGETVASTVKGGAEVASVAATLKVLTTHTQSSIEDALIKCVEWANDEVNDKRFGGNSPTPAQCQEVLGNDPCGNTVTRAMLLGKQKHRLALQCAELELGKLIPKHFSLEQRYRQDPQTGQTQLVSREEARALLQRGCGAELEGTIVPDVVIHSGNPLEALAVYDLKFPCPFSNEPSWRDYEEGHPHHGSNQGDIYRNFLRVIPKLVAPIWRINQ